MRQSNHEGAPDRLDAQANARGRQGDHHQRRGLHPHLASRCYDAIKSITVPVIEVHLVRPHETRGIPAYFLYRHGGRERSKGMGPKGYIWRWNTPRRCKEAHFPPRISCQPGIPAHSGPQTGTHEERMAETKGASSRNGKMNVDTDTGPPTGGHAGRDRPDRNRGGRRRAQDPRLAWRRCAAIPQRACAQITARARCRARCRCRRLPRAAQADPANAVQIADGRHRYLSAEPGSAAFVKSATR